MKENHFRMPREQELQQLQQLLAYTVEGTRGIAVITGDSGVGKTYLVEEFVRQSRGEDRTYIYGKFSQHDHRVLGVFTDMIQQIVKFLITLSNKQLQSICQELKKRLGSDVGILTSICPYAEKVFGKQKWVFYTCNYSLYIPIQLCYNGNTG